MLIQQLTDVGRHTREIVESHQLDDRASLGGRFATPAEAPQSLDPLHVCRSTPGTQGTWTSFAS